MTVTRSELDRVLAIDRRDGTLVGEVHDGWDVFGIPHGGYVAALSGNALLRASGAPDLFTITVHFLRKAALGEVAFDVQRVGGGRRLGTWSLTATQGGQTILTAVASLGDRDDVAGPTWTDATAWVPVDDQLSPPAGSSAMEERFPTPAIAHRFGQRLDTSTVGFAGGGTGDRAVLRTTVATDQPDQLAALIACDITPPAVWNVLGAAGWVPTVELTAHVRARPAPGPLTIEVATHHVADGFLEEDALVRDATGRLVVQSRQLALAPAGPG